jgi:hypothetical protein
MIQVSLALAISQIGRERVLVFKRARIIPGTSYLSIIFEFPFHLFFLYQRIYCALNKTWLAVNLPLYPLYQTAHILSNLSQLREMRVHNLNQYASPYFLRTESKETCHEPIGIPCYQL